MVKKVLILSGSPRHGGNSDTLCDQFLKGASEAGHDVEKYFISAHNIGFCSACYYCSSHDGVCCKKDDMNALMPKILEADVLVFASPVYMYSVSAQLKAVFDRMVAKYETRLFHLTLMLQCSTVNQVVICSSFAMAVLISFWIKGLMAFN